MKISLEGKKTLIATIILALAGVTQLWIGNWDKGLELIAIALGFFGIRAKLEKI